MPGSSPLKETPRGSASRTPAKKGAASAQKGVKPKARPKAGGAAGAKWHEAVMTAAEKSGLLAGKSSRIGGRISPALIRQAKKRTGIETDNDLIEFALANVALEDGFAEVFKQSRGKVDPDLELGF